MQGQITVFHPNGAVDVTHYTGEMPADALQKAVGGFIEIVPFFRTIAVGDKIVSCVAFCNEEGKLQKLPFNQPIMDLWRSALSREGNPLFVNNDYLVGSVAVVMGDSEFMEAL